MSLKVWHVSLRMLAITRKKYCFYFVLLDIVFQEIKGYDHQKLKNISDIGMKWLSEDSIYLSTVAFHAKMAIRFSRGTPQFLNILNLKVVARISEAYTGGQILPVISANKSRATKQ